MTEESRWQRLYRDEALALAEIGAMWSRIDLPRIEVRLPRDLADRAVTAWERDDNEGPVEPETHEQRTLRHRAGSLGLIGLAIQERGRWEDGRVVVELNPSEIGVAIDASDDLPPDSPAFERSSAPE
jgi:hypothetical protein